MSFFDKYKKEELQTEELPTKTGSFFDKYKQPTEQVEAKKPSASDKLTLDSVADDSSVMNTLQQYADSRFGEEGKRLPNESNKEYLQRFMTHVRQFESNSVELAGQIDWLRGASQADKAKFAKLYTTYQDLPTPFEEGGDSVLRATRDYVFSLASDPLTLITAGVGKLGTTAAQKAATKSLLEAASKKTAQEVAKKGALTAAEQTARMQAKKKGMKGATKQILGAGAVEGALGAGMSIGLQEVEKKSGLREDTSLTEAAIAAGLGAAVGGGFSALAARGAGKQAVETTAQELKRVADDELAEELQSGAKAASRDLYEFDELNGYKVREALRPLADVKDTLSDVALKSEMQRRIAKASNEILEDLADKGEVPDIFKQKGTKASEVVRTIMFGEQDIDSTVLDGALSRAGISVTDFLDFSGVSLQDAAKTMSSYSQTGKILNRIRDIDPTAANQLKQYVDKDSSTIGIFGRAHEFMQYLDRNRRALMVTQLSTTVRNVATAGARLTFEGAANLIDSSIYHLGKSVNATLQGRVSAKGVKEGFKDLLRDSMGTVMLLNQSSTTKRASEKLLKYNPQLARILDRSLQEVGEDQSLHFLARKANTLNIAQDLFFRRAVFVNSVDKILRRTAPTIDGKKITGVADFLATGKQLPSAVLKDAVEESLSFTFSRMPKPKGGKMGDTFAYHFVKLNEAVGPLPGAIGIPFGTGAFPFARFMANAIQFQFEYSPLNFVSSIQSSPKLLKYARGLADAKDMKALAKAREDFSKATVGTAALMAAIKYRAENQDVKWYEARGNDERPYDLRPFFPAAPYLMVADLIVKWGDGRLNEASAKDVLEGLTGAQLRAGLSSYMVDSLFETISSEGGLTGVKAEKMAEYVGGYVGELGGGFVTPTRVVSDVIAAFNEEAAIVRDARQVEGVGAAERGLSSAKNQFLKNLPVFQESLPEFQSPTRSQRIMRQSPLTKQLLGITYSERRTDIEDELIAKGYESFEIVPSTGDKTADAFVKKYMGSYVENNLGDLINTERYEKMSNNEQKAAIRNKLIQLRAVSKELGKAEAVGAYEEAYTPFDRAEWGRLSNLERGLADDYYMEKHGKTVVEMQMENPGYNHLKFGKLIGRALRSQTK